MQLHVGKVYLPDFAMDSGRSMKEDCTLHKILNACTLDLLQEVPSGLLPCSVVDL